MAEEVCTTEILSSGVDELGPQLKALLLAQPLNPLRKLEFRELPSRLTEGQERDNGNAN